MFSRAIVRTPGRSLVDGLSSAGLGKPDYPTAILQHLSYIHALETCGLEVEVLDPWDEFPDSTFIEDVALLTPYCALLTNPGAPSRNGETEGIREVLEQYCEAVEEIRSPGTLEGGDVMMVGTHFYIGLSDRTNQEGADQAVRILNKYGLSGSTVPLAEFLHLKTGVSYLEDGNLLVSGEFIFSPIFSEFNRLVVREEESYAANSLWVNDYVLVPEGFPLTRQMIQEAGYGTIEINVSEFRKLDGGLSCLSLRF